MKIEVIQVVSGENSELPPLLFVHGAYHGAWCWNEFFIPYFSSLGFSCYALSLRGHGKSEGHEKLHSFSLNDYMDDVLEVMNPLHMKPVLIGHSMGGAIVQKIMHLHSNQVQAAVLLASLPPNGMLKTLIRLFLTDLKGMLQLRNFNERRSVHFPGYLLFSRKLPDRIKQKYADLLQPESNRAAKEMSRRIIPKTVVNKVPVLVLGSQQDYLFPENTVRNIGKSYKTEPVIFSNMGHDMMLDPDWKKAADHILTFVRTSV